MAWFALRKQDSRKRPERVEPYRVPHIRVDEVEVFGVFGGDLPATASLP
jgi:hypothetical protein